MRQAFSVTSTIKDFYENFHRPATREFLVRASAKNLEKSYIKLYDEVIVEGNGLYDSKIV